MAPFTAGVEYKLREIGKMLTQQLLRQQVGETQCNCTNPLHAKRISELLNNVGGDNSVVRVPDSLLKGCGFEFLQEWQNFLLQGRLSLLNSFGIRSTPVLPQ